jgi:hypothetical protein
LTFWLVGTIIVLNNSKGVDEMKKLIVSALIGLTALASSVAQAHPPYYYRGPGYGWGGYGSHGHVDWIAPAIIGGVIGYAIAQPRYVAPPPTVIYQQPIRIIPGPIQIPPVGYHYEDFYDNGCGCYRTTLVPNY